MLPNNSIILNSPQPQSNSDRIKKLVSKKAIKGLSVVQLVCSVIAIITHNDYDYAYHIARKSWFAP